MSRQAWSKEDKTHTLRASHQQQYDSTSGMQRAQLDTGTLCERYNKMKGEVGCCSQGAHLLALSTFDLRNNRINFLIYFASFFSLIIPSILVD